MPNRVPWDQSFSVGNDLLDDQHRQILADCGALADYCAADHGNGDDAEFRYAFDRLMAFARTHFATETSLLVDRNFPDLDSYRHECDEYEYLSPRSSRLKTLTSSNTEIFTLWWASLSWMKPNSIALT
jgi:hemerythrin